MTAPRIIVPGATTAISRRTTLRKAFLAPWDPRVGDIWLYALADAQRRTGVAVHHAIRVVTHHHLCATPERANLPKFLQLFHHDTSCGLNALLAKERYDQPGELFDDRSTHLMRLLDAPAQASSIQYEYLNCTAAGLVSRPQDMPGYTFDFDLWKTGYLDVTRPDIYFGRGRPEVIRLEVTPPPLLLLEFNGDVDKLVYHMKRIATEAQRELKAARRGRPPLGARALTRMHPWAEPRTLRETRGKRIPTFRIGARGIVGQELHIQAAIETRDFRQHYRRSERAHQAGNTEVEFPYGTYQLRELHSVRVAEAPDPAHALVTAPGPLLRDVLAMLEEQREQRRQSGEPPPEIPVEMCENLKSAFRDEADAICEHASGCMDFDQAPPRVAGARTSAGSTSAAPRGDVQGDEARDDEVRDDEAHAVVVRHRFSRDRNPHRKARRLVTHRDRRIGRPPKNRHGTDPPA